VFLSDCKGWGMMENKGLVFYNGKQYEVLFKYSSGYCEIKEIGGLYKIELVHESEITSLT
jgi:hypothetical protein